MRVTVNLATRPFVELGPLYRRLRIVAAVLVVLAISLAFGVRAANRNARIQQAQLDVLIAQTNAKRREFQQAQASMQQPQNAAVLERAQFLNHLFTRKSFSWTAAMMDLEDVLPPGVQVVSLDPALTPDERVTVKLRVSGPRSKAVDLVRNLERSKHFRAPRLVGESKEQEPGGAGSQFRDVSVSPTDVTFDLLAEYNPLELPEKRSGKNAAPTAAPVALSPPHASLTATPVAAAPAPVPVPSRRAAPAPRQQSEASEQQSPALTPPPELDGRVPNSPGAASARRRNHP